MPTKICIASPCSALWDLMEGDERVRYCTQCKLNVYNLSAMRGSEVEKLIAETEGRLCARFYRRADGTMLTQDCPRGFRAAVKRAVQFAAAAFAALMSVAPAIAQSGAQTLPRPTNAAEKVEFEAVVLVLDPQDAAIAGAEVNLTAAATSIVYSGRSDRDGRARFSGLPIGNYDVAVMATGFTKFVANNLALPSEQVIKARLNIGQGGAIVVIETGDQRPIENVSAEISAPLYEESYEAILESRPRKNLVQKIGSAIKRIF